MFWDYAGDPTGALLNALDMGLKPGHGAAGQSN